MKKIFLILLIFIAILPKINVISVAGNGAGIRAEDFIILALFLYYVKVLYISKTKTFSSIHLRKVTSIFTVYIFISLCSTILGIAIGNIKLLLGVLYFLRKIEYFVLFFVGYDVFYEKRFTKKSLYNFLDLCVIFHFAFSILQILGIVGSFNRGEALTSMTQGRVSSTFNGAYELSAFLLLLFPFYLNDMKYNKKGRFKNLILITIIIFCVYESESRTSLIALAAMLLIFFVRELKRKFIFYFSIIIGALAICIILLFSVDLSDGIDSSRFSTIDFNEMITATVQAWKYKSFDVYVSTGSWYGKNYNVDLSSADSSFVIRVNHWMQLIDGVLKYPLIGCGASISGGSADGNYVRVLSESGILGFFVWCYMYIYILKTLKEKDQFINSVKYGLITMLFGAIFIDVFEASKIMMFFWMLLGAAYALKEEKNDKEYSNN